jgi:2-polyprenyl-6-methoxyphenol hydroxylase-like FAD-dependent oxidoreductase
LATSSGFKVIVVAGSLSGLAFALAYLRDGIQFDLYEREREFGSVGTGVEIAPNTTRVLNKLGLKKELEAISSPFSEKYVVRSPLIRN